jgi:hypothetical protein
LERQVAKHAIRWNAITMIKQKRLANVLLDESFPHKPILGTVWQLFAGFLAQCTIIGAFVKRQSFGRAFNGIPWLLLPNRGETIEDTSRRVGPERVNE